MSLLSGPSQYAPRLNKMGAVDHFSSDSQNARVRLCLERVNDRLGVGELVGGGSEGGVDRRDLGGVNGKLAGEALGGGGAGLGDQARFVAEIGEDSVDGLDLCGDGPGEAERTGELVGEGQFAAGSIFGTGTKR